ncbi:MAG TPA: efflux RND transporter periplasmic adaptor subunit [Burkholderiales bacterium]|nr:efflux RND transporter periplasmic adaptor subunit [Burkholderiales bacterium]
MALSKLKLVMISILILFIAGGTAYWYFRSHAPDNGITLYGNIDIRQVQAAFNDNGRILDLRVKEGEPVKKGQLLAELDPVRFQDAVIRDREQVAAQSQVLARLLAGSRPEEIAEARAELAAAQAALSNAKVTWKRQQYLETRHYVSKQSLDNASAVLKTALANSERAQQSLNLAIKGSRKEDVSAARHTLAASQAVLSLAERELVDTKLYSPENGVVQDRILEPGDMANPQIPVFTLALDNPVWVRAYLPEKLLGQIQPGMKAWILSDSFPGKRFQGWVGFISPEAEFTPKTVETTELRTELVYRVRIYACNPGYNLRLGMPVTVNIPPQDKGIQGLGIPHCGD